MNKTFEISPNAVPAVKSGFICPWCGKWFNPATGKTYRYVKDYKKTDGLLKKCDDGSFKYKTFDDLVRYERRLHCQHKIVEKDRKLFK